MLRKNTYKAVSTALNNLSTKNFFNSNYSKHFSTNVDLSINIHMQKNGETEVVNKIVEDRDMVAIGSIKLNLEIIRLDLAAVKADLAIIGTDLSDLKLEADRQFTKIHQQASKNVQIIMTSFFGVSAATMAINQYLNAKKDDISGFSVENPLIKR